jgi:hypothetical protein
MPSAALIPVLSFVAMTAPPQTGVTILSSGLAAEILIDATIVRCLLAPAGAGPTGPCGRSALRSAARPRRPADHLMQGVLRAH